MYVDKEDLFIEICESIHRGELTSNASSYLVSIAEEAIHRLVFIDPMDKEDCTSFAVLDLLRYWRGFNPIRYNNAFAYYTQIAKHGYAKGWSRLHPSKYKNTISISGSDDDSDGLYSI